MRKQLGWGTRDLARRLGCKNEQVLAWEDDRNIPSDNVCDKLERFAQLRKDAINCIEKSPVAEEIMREQGLEQIKSEDI